MEMLGAGDPLGVPPAGGWGSIGAYRLLARLGAGGMGQVYLARSDRGRTVAVKLVREELATREEFRDRFRQEVRAARQVGGYWTAPVLDADTEAAVPWVATGYVAGPSLQQVVGHDHGALPERSVRILAAGLAHALKDIHAAGIVHRDLKPSNVLVTIDGPRVIDFGIARALETVTDGGLTRTGALVGSPGFMAPEQVRGDRVTPACDVFCLGSVLAYAATGKLPFGTANSGVHALMFRIAQEEPDLEGVPEGIAELVRACLRKDPAARPTLDQVLARTGAEDTVSDGRSRDPWLPSALVAQLGRHAVQLLDAEDPERPGGGEATPEHASADDGSGAGMRAVAPGHGAVAGAGAGGVVPGHGPAAGAPGGVATGPGSGSGHGPAGGSTVPSGHGVVGGAGAGGVVPGDRPAAGVPGGGATGSGHGPACQDAMPSGHGPAGEASGQGAVPPAPGQPGAGGGAPLNHLPTVVAGQSPAAGHPSSPAASYPSSTSTGHSHPLAAGHPSSPAAGHSNPLAADHPSPPAAGHPQTPPAGQPHTPPPPQGRPQSTPPAGPPTPGHPGAPTHTPAPQPAHPAHPAHSAYGYPQPHPQQPQTPVHGYPHHPQQPQTPGYGYPSQPGAPSSYNPYGPTATPPYGPGATPPYGPGPAYPPPPEPRRNGRSTAALIAVALVVALAAGGSVFAMMSSDGSGDDEAGPTPTPTATAPTTPGPTTDAPTPTPTTSAPADGTIPAGYLGTWTSTIDNAEGQHTRQLTIQDGEVGDTVLSLVADGPDYHCVFEADLAEAPAAEGPLRIGPSTVTVGEPASSCTPGSATEITLLSDGTLERVNTGNGEKLTYTKQ